MCYPRGGIFFFFPHLFHPEGNKSIPNFLPLVGLLHGKLPLVHFYRKLEVCTSVHTTVLPTPTLPPPDPAGVLRFPCQSSSPGKPVYTTELSPGGREAEPARAGSSRTLGPSAAEMSVPGHVWHGIHRHLGQTWHTVPWAKAL